MGPFVRVAAAATALIVIAATAGCGSTVRGTAVAEPFAPTTDNPDPSLGIEGITVIEYPVGLHVRPQQRVAYDRTPPFGGPHDAVWADCTGTVYDTPIRSENAVHSLEHGAVWITYDPKLVTGTDLARLVGRVEGQPYLMMSPYPGLSVPISLQSWGHQLVADGPSDSRIDHFVEALRLNRNTFPEPGATCSTLPDVFDVDNPPPFQAGPPDRSSPDTVPMN
ncbi:DUF3105 domain-containing protein [Rhodococcus sp. TAF43]|uniref:DUF3105 domain-containing protein n=1 Tax=unclassified Rhodococcus (in: high G+C Gram-positive bacteria) TaxID=192944 RepID=UPI001581D32B|nr:DUF3105 domain-containing protein [Rhodococcus sp. W8901]QKT11204.1 DUF3105 domain-containing protein [Rhodococcus sp. W8901]